VNDIIESYKRAIIDQKWIFGERMNRIGDPFLWVDGEQLSQFDGLSSALSVLQYLAMSGEIYETPSSIRTDDYEELKEVIEDRLRRAYSYFVPFLSSQDYEFESYIKSTSSVKVQDYCALRTFCDLKDGVSHLDIGPGLGANAIYSLWGLNSTYYSLEAFPQSYSVQRLFLRAILGGEPSYLDLVECENFGLSHSEMQSQLNDAENYRVKHVPSWHFNLVDIGSVDLVTSTWVLNEVTPAGITWLLWNTDRVLRPDGYFYIRDSGKRKPNRHDLDYDLALLEMGYEKVGFLDIRNRVDMHGIPRAYRKKRDRLVEFEALFEQFFGRFSVTSHGGNYMQNIDNGENASQ
jgi:SAM-dependent methyltransferase